MELFESELLDQNQLSQSQTALAVEPEPRYQPAATASLPIETNEHGHTWIRTIGLILIGLVLVVAIVLLARWAYHQTHHDNSKKSPSKVSTGTKLYGTGNKLEAGSDSSLQNSSPSAPTNSASSDRTATPLPASSTKIANTGPGNVVGLFVASSLAAAGLHFVISLRRFNRA